MSSPQNDSDGTLFGRALIEECKRRMMDESHPRIVKCVAQLTDEEIWRRPNEETVSIGNLILHICGNIRQWIVSGLGGAQDTRTRSKEFSEKGPIPREALLRTLDETMKDTREALDKADPSSLLRIRNVQGNEETGLSMLVHVTEHMSYHTGEITYAVKSTKSVDLAYYGDEDLEVTN